MLLQLTKPHRKTIAAVKCRKDNQRRVACGICVDDKEDPRVDPSSEPNQTVPPAPALGAEHCFMRLPS